MRHHARSRNALVAGVAAAAATASLAAGASAAASATATGAAASRTAAVVRTAPGLAAPILAAPTLAAQTLAAATLAAAAASARPVLLINGDRLVIRSAPSGRRAVALLPAPGPGPLLALNTGKVAEVIPAYALPYLGHGLDASLFDLSALQREETGAGLPVQIAFAAGRKPHLPGVTITRWAPGSAAGYLTAASARSFGAALERQARTDYGRASYGADGMFAGGVDITLAGTAPPAVHARPQFPMDTLTVTASNLKGKRDTGDSVAVINAGNPLKFGDPDEIFSSFYHGTAKYSVPAGHYWAIADFTNSSFTSQRLVVLPQVTVKGQTTVHLAERAATSQLTLVTPRRAVLQSAVLNLVRYGLHGTAASIEAVSFGGPLWISPTTNKTTVGSLRAYTSALLTSPAKTAGTRYVYNLALAGPAGIIPAQHFDITPASVATVHERYYQDVSSSGAWMTFGGFPDSFGDLFTLVAPLPLPGLQTQYMSAGSAIAWTTSYIEFLDSYSDTEQSSALRTYRAGQQLTEAWNRYPLHPQQDVQLLHGTEARLFPQYASAFRMGDTLWLSPIPFSDNQAGHSGAGLVSAAGVKLTGSYAIYQDGVKIAHGNPVNGIAPVNLSAKPAVIRLALSTGRSGKPYPESPASQTVWTWRSVRHSAATVPASWFCGYVLIGNQFERSRRCSVQPLLTLDYRVRGLALSGTAPPGRQAIGLTVGHTQLAKAAPITSASAQVSYNNGQTWQAATLTASGGGNFRIAFTAPAGVDPTLRVSATDAAGSSISETVIRAYGVAS